MSAEKFMDAGEEILRKIRATQLPAIKEAAALIADSIAHGGALHYFDTGHCTGELLGRAGGLFAIHPLQVNINISHPKPPTHPEKEAKSWYDDQRVREFALDQAHFQKGDVLLLGSVSGSKSYAVSLAMEIRERGVKVIAITSPTYSKAIPSQDPSAGQFLYQVADVVIDNCGEVGDVLLDIPGLDTKACPSSGLAFVYIAWSLIAQVLSNLTERGIKPQVYKSINLPEGREFNEKAKQAYERAGI
ncbi:MAG: hypothetical protein CVU38_08810 [Chloroflexi bacterium HGW-Chloroflexi-1]|nr:MAG: hypothetical protein CVU38_08810 [Chloroflexi bacterium HGW-Chloroflexi-1]